MRKALIGFSSPTAYFYDHDRQYFNEPWRWNPILESPQGLLTLYDELWFITRALCPVNLRNENYVKFLDDDSTYQTIVQQILSDFTNKKFEEFVLHYPYLNEIMDTSKSFITSAEISNYGNIVRQVYGKKTGSGLPLDNHSHNIEIFGNDISGNSFRIDLLALDNVICDYLYVPNLELITNRFNSSYINPKYNTLNQIITSQAITVKRIPVSQTPVGPVLQNIEQIRENNYLVDFRNKIISNSKIEDAQELVPKIETEFNNYRNQLLIDKHKDATLATSLSNTILTVVKDSMFSGLNAIQEIGEKRNTRKMDWTAFVSKIDKNGI
ncbi:hypothetical protein GCM10008015_20870 [Flavobacterium palustre]|uniref:Uncharacterized protein n=1 Tax=Flavobacterium palustre TaxID=1476463 RepID=A0ABQ1HK95_9FLAO|nr:hypothetical protein [Flavobacterium palustre]GGA80013.1 hypothetical protein GCM10008015_20870 [Flavobacterium palustre]